MENDDENESFIKRKKLIMRINSGELNQNLLHYINEARSSPKDFSRHLMVDDDVDEKIAKLSLFFKYSSKEVFPLIYDENLEKCSQSLLYHIISLDDGSSSFKFSKEEKELNCLRERLKMLNLEPTSHIDLLIIGVDDSIEALSNILLNKIHRENILSPEMRYIGIASGLLPSDRLCFVIDIVHSLKIINNFFYPKPYIQRPNKYNKIRYIYNEQDDDECNDEEYYKDRVLNTYNNINQNNRNNYSFNPIYRNINNFYNEKKHYNKRKYFNSVGVSPFIRTNYDGYENNKSRNYRKKNKNEEINLRISKQESLFPSNSVYFREEDFSYYPKEYKIPVSVSLEKKYARNQDGKLFPILSKETKYDDGSILIQPYVDYDDS